jgi:hypothetical protein
VARLFEASCEPFAVQTRRVREDEIKMIWWYVAAVNEGEPVDQHEDYNFVVELQTYDTALERLTFKDDRELVKKAITLVQSSIGSQG